MSHQIVPYHQFEIRYDPILNFPSVSREIFGPYVQRTDSFNLEFENLKEERITLNFNGGNQIIVAFWDRLIFISNIGLDGLESSQSLVAEAFFSMLTKLKDVQTFGRITGGIFLVLGIKLDVEESSLTTFIENYVKDNKPNSVLPGYNDASISLRLKNKLQQTDLNFGPYSGLSDFTDRSIILTASQLELIKDKSGMMYDYKILLFKDNQFDFKIYKELLHAYKETISKL